MYFPEHETAKMRMEELIKTRERERLARDLHRAGKDSRRGLGVRAVAFITTLFRI